MVPCILCSILIFATYVDSKGLVTMFNPCLMDLSYLTLKETTADDRTVRTHHILERTHNDDEFQIINGHYLSYSGHCNVSLIWVLLTKTAHLFYDNHSEHECSLPGQHGHVCWTIVNNLILNSFQSIMADHFWIRIHSMWICRFTWPKSFQ